jgi:hypothetical protein
MECDGVRVFPHERGVRLDRHQVRGRGAVEFGDGHGGSRLVGHGVRRVVHALIGPRGGGRDNAVSDLPAGAEIPTGHRGRGVLLRMADKKVTESRPGSLQEGLEQGKQGAADS